MDDKQIIRLFFERSEQAITELSQKYGDLCMKIARSILNDHQDAEECVNDAYLGASASRRRSAARRRWQPRPQYSSSSSSAQSQRPL